MAQKFDMTTTTLRILLLKTFNIEGEIFLRLPWRHATKGVEWWLQ